MIYILIYLLIGAVITLCFEKFMLNLLDEYVNSHDIEPQMEKKMRVRLYVFLILAWPTVFIPTKEKKKGDDTDV